MSDRLKSLEEQEQEQEISDKHNNATAELIIKFDEIIRLGFANKELCCRDVVVSATMSVLGFAVQDYDAEEIAEVITRLCKVIKWNRNAYLEEQEEKEGTTESVTATLPKHLH